MTEPEQGQGLGGDGVARAQEDSDVVVVPGGLARRIRLALDHAHRNPEANPDNNYTRLADELVALPDYPTWKEPWGE